jgi:hypothetical protein
MAHASSPLKIVFQKFRTYNHAVVVSSSVFGGYQKQEQTPDSYQGLGFRGFNNLKTGFWYIYNHDSLTFFFKSNNCQIL